jgi:hypothetical protein
VTFGFFSMTSAMARASTLSFIVTPHWWEIVSSNWMSFIDLKIFPWWTSDIFVS